MPADSTTCFAFLFTASAGATKPSSFSNVSRPTRTPTLRLTFASRTSFAACAASFFFNWFTRTLITRRFRLHDVAEPATISSTLVGGGHLHLDSSGSDIGLSTIQAG